MKEKAAKYGLFAAGTALLVFLDRLSKNWAVKRLMGQAPIELWPGVFEFHYLENYGMAFGLLQNQQVFFYIASALILLAVLYLLYRTPFTKRFLPMIIVLTVMTGGAVGNLIDRISTKYVVDFLFFKLINFPIFNVADSFVTLSAISLFILLLFVYKDEEFTKVYGFGKKETAAKEMTAPNTPDDEKTKTPDETSKEEEETEAKEELSKENAEAEAESPDSLKSGEK